MKSLNTRARLEFRRADGRHDDDISFTREAAGDASTHSAITSLHARRGYCEQQIPHASRGADY